VQQNLILAGVGGQGILTIAQAISYAALQRGMHIKQAEVHGMSQRGGDVQSHLRISTQEIYSDLVPEGEADLLIAVEPLESLRYVHYLRPDAVALSNINPYININNYPPQEDLLERISSRPKHILIDAELFAKTAGTARAANIVMLGAASLFLILDTHELEHAITAIFAAKGEKIVESNIKAFHIGRNAATAYLSGLQRGASSTAILKWLVDLNPEYIANPQDANAPKLEC
jgi:indolepyruvate ferredoxin oxidoreductase beta subunit